MQKGKQALLLHLGVCLCSTVLLPCRRFYFIWPRFPTLPSNLNLFFSLFSLSHSFHVSLIYQLFFSDFLPLCEEHPSPDSPLHLFPPPFQPQLIFSLLLVMLQRSCGNSGIMPLVLWPWPGGQFLGPEGCCFSSLYPKLGGTGQWAGAGRMNSWMVGGQQRPQRSPPLKTLASSSKVWGERGSCFWSRKRALVSLRLTKDTAMQPAKQALSQTTTPSFSCHVITFSVFLCTAAGIITFVLQHSNNIWCLFLIYQAVSVHISDAVASDI